MPSNLFDWYSEKDFLPQDEFCLLEKALSFIQQQQSLATVDETILFLKGLP